MINIDQVNEFELWSSHFLGYKRTNKINSLIEFRKSSHRIFETPQEIHKRLSQDKILAQISNIKT